MDDKYIISVIGTQSLDGEEDTIELTTSASYTERNGKKYIKYREYDPENEEFWKSVGMLHDIDFELYPDQHCVKALEILHDEDIDEDMIHAVVSHGFGICSDVAPEKFMEKVLFAVDELTGLIGAAALMRPTGISDMEAKSVMKKFKDKKFAAGCSREVISRGAEMLEMELKDLMDKTITAMRDNPVE